MPRILIIVATIFAAAACGKDGVAGAEWDAAVAPISDGGGVDGGHDMGGPADGGRDAAVDASGDRGVDASMDAGTDAGGEVAGDGADAGADGLDAGGDAGMDGGFDAGVDGGVDAGADAGVDSGVDAGLDGGVDADVDAGVDAGSATTYDVCGFAEDGPWVQVEYSQNGGAASTPTWSYSNTAWGQAEWAMTNDSRPEVWDVFNNISVSSDPIGVLAKIGPSARFQLMFGLQDLTNYQSASVCIEGRSVSATASVFFDVYNPLNGCGANASMAHDWQVHAAGIDLGKCLVAGGGVQAIRIETTGGSSTLGIKRMRLTLHGVVY